MAVVGSGPAGFYTSYRVMSLIENAKVDMYEALPVPFGLVRFGVAPDHPEVKVRFLVMAAGGEGGVQAYPTIMLAVYLMSLSRELRTHELVLIYGSRTARTSS